MPSLSWTALGRSVTLISPMSLRLHPRFFTSSATVGSDGNLCRIYHKSFLFGDAHNLFFHFVQGTAGIIVSSSSDSNWST